LRPEKNISRLALARVSERTPGALVIVGDGAERRAFIFTGVIEDPARLLGAFDVFAISSDTEQMPLSVLEAMGAGLPIAGVNVGDVKEMVSPENRPFIVNPEPTALATALLDLLSDGEARSRIGAANGQRVRKDYTLDQMVRAYTELYQALIQSGFKS
jgi:glycosyltransferase involved in cell wall biosynthesis